MADYIIIIALIKKRACSRTWIPRVINKEKGDYKIDIDTIFLVRVKDIEKGRRQRKKKDAYSSIIGAFLRKNSKKKSKKREG